MTPFHLPLTPDWLYWRYPWVFAALLLLIPLWWLWLRPQRRSALRFSSLDVADAAGATAGLAWRVFLPALRTAGIAALVIACARPQRADATSQTFAEGIAIYMVLDTSSSMYDRDLDPEQQKTRLDVVKEVFYQFVMGDSKRALPGRPNDLIGIIRFARFPDSLCPLTLDRSSLLEALAQVQLINPYEQESEDGTAIGDGLGLAVERLKDLKRTSGSGAQLTIRSRIVILLTDGENNLGTLAPAKAGELAASFGIKVYTILAGTGQRAGMVRRPVDDSELRQIAEVTGGKFYRAVDPNALREVYSEIDLLERSQTEERRFEHFEELSEPWLFAALGALVLHVLLDATWLRKTP